MGAGRQNDDGRKLESFADTAGDDQAQEQRLLDAVLQETMGTSNQEALDLVFRVARESKHDSTASIEAVVEVVREIVKRRLGDRKFSRRLIHRIAYSLIETPEATVRLERLWQEARASG